MVSDTRLGVVALKEWAAVGHALLDGRQTLLLRKGGIHERTFDAAVTDQDPFVLFPTIAHSHVERTRIEHRDLLAAGAADVADETITVRCGLRLVDAVQVAAPDRLPELADLHIWTDASVAEDRVAFRPKHPLHALVVDAVALPEPATLPREERFAGCRSWLELPLAWDGRSGQSVHGRDRLVADAARVRATVG